MLEENVEKNTKAVQAVDRIVFRGTVVITVVVAAGQFVWPFIIIYGRKMGWF